MDIAKLRELMEKATPGPWGENVGYISSSTAKEYRGKAIIAAPVAAVHDVVDRREQNKANAALIVAAVNALPSLIARLEAAEKVVEAARLFKEWCDKEKAGPQWSSELGRNGPNGEAEWSEWWNEQLWLAGEGPRQVAEALTTYDQEKARG